MASATISFFSPITTNTINSTTNFFTPRPCHPQRQFAPLNHGRRCRGLTVAMAGPDLLGDLGARDPFPEEVASNFAEKVLGNTDTLHRILIPSLSALSLACLPCQPSPSPLEPDHASKLLKKVVGWRLVEFDEMTRLQCFWKVKDSECGEELIKRINKAVEGLGHYPNLRLEQPNQVIAELWTASVGGLSMNDFIIAARIDQIKTLDLLPRKRIWA